MNVFLLLWLLLAAAVGYMGRDRAAGFLGTFLAAVFFTPLVVVIVLLLSQPARPARPVPPVSPARPERLN